MLVIGCSWLYHGSGRLTARDACPLSPAASRRTCGRWRWRRPAARTEVSAMGDELPGRSRLRSTMTRSRYITVHVTPDERALLAAAAETSSMSASSWVRHQALRAAGVAPAPASLQAPPAGRSPRKVERLIRGRFTTAEHEAIVEHARGCGLTVSALIRRLVLGSAPMTRRPLLRSAIVAVHRAGDNL